ncbi:hypothetical protein A6R68_08478 [Neotoma lepida]|uniref:HAUS augmin-like complex subunit 2 n=1 Tax=Neotoma lepida TaxID=56216 RepID=A0A1A6G3I2_NEOLE|nr:hypothetical protein A6R68_08478 [Neotoma lepida]
MAAANPWDPASAPSAAGLLLKHWVASGIVTEEMLDISKKMAPCFVNFSRLQQISDIQAEICQNNLEIELLQLEKDTADLTHPSYLVEKCDILQSMSNHLEAVLKEKRAIRQRLLRPICQENLPMEAVYHRLDHEAEMENYACLFKSKALAKMDILVNKTEELAENILKWREQQKEISMDIPKILTEESYLHKLNVMPPLPFVSKVHAQTDAK